MRQWVTLTAAVALVAATAACSHRDSTNSSMSSTPSYSAPSYSGSTTTAPGQDLRHGGSSTQSLGVAPPGGDTSSTAGAGGSSGSGASGGSGAGGASGGAGGAAGGAR